MTIKKTISTMTREDMVAEDRRQYEIMLKRTAEKKAIIASGKVPPLTENQKRPLIGNRTPTKRDRPNPDEATYDDTTT